VLTIDRFTYLPEFHVIIYKEYKYTMLPSYIDVYFTGTLYKLEVDKRRRIIEEVAKVNRLIITEEVLY